MRQIIVRSQTSNNWLNRDCLVTETMRHGDCVSMVRRRCTYRVASRVTVPSTLDAMRWARNIDPRPPRQVYVTKGLHPETGAEQITYKILGHFYVVLDRDVFCVAYRHILSMTVEPTEVSCE